MQSETSRTGSIGNIKRRTVLLLLSGAVLLVSFSTIALAPAARYREYQKLVVNLADSTIGLHIKGVGIHQTRVHEFSKDKFLERIPLPQEIKLLSEPLPVVSRLATIVKEPVVVRHAPRDTMEASLNVWQPDTLVQNPAFVSLVTRYGLQIILEQDTNGQLRDHWKKFRFHTRIQAGKALRAAANILRFSRQQYQPVISIKMPVDDLRAIYRALPDSTLIVLRL